MGREYIETLEKIFSVAQPSAEEVVEANNSNQRQVAYARCCEVIRNLKWPVTRKAVLAALNEVANKDTAWRNWEKFSAK
jgi:uncharacterized tellurite resistance protein B-like protein